MTIASSKVPVLVSVGLICFLLGAGAGGLVMAVYGDQWTKPKVDANGQPGQPGGPPAAMGMGGQPGMGGRMGNRGPNSKNQLATLVTKLDQLSRKPLTLTLSDQQRKQLSEQLQGLAEKEELNEEDAKKRLDAILDILKDNKPTLDAAGYRWPGQRGGFRPPADVPNPFKDDENNKRLKSLQQQLGKEITT